MLFHLQVSLGTQHQLDSLMTRLVHLLEPLPRLATDISPVIMNIWRLDMDNRQTKTSWRQVRKI